jgi:uncharacterized protein YbjT (DUF2867 family)
MTTPILLTGGTGTLGRQVAPLLRAAGADVRVLSRRPQVLPDGGRVLVGDLDTGVGVAAAVDGVRVIVHCAGSATGDDHKTRTLVEAAARYGAPHLVSISVVGADRVPVRSRLDRAMFGYFAAKLAAEEVAATSGLPWTTLRATQFHDLTLATVARLATLPVVPVPHGFAFQPVETREVAERLVELALGAPAGLVPDLAGPEVLTTDALVRSYLRAVGRRRLLVPVALPGGAARAVRAGANLAVEPGTGQRRWEDFLAEHTAAAVAATTSSV